MPQRTKRSTATTVTPNAPARAMVPSRPRRPATCGGFTRGSLRRSPHAAATTVAGAGERQLDPAVAEWCGVATQEGVLRGVPPRGAAGGDAQLLDLRRDPPASGEHLEQLGVEQVDSGAALLD